MKIRNRKRHLSSASRAFYVLRLKRKLLKTNVDELGDALIQAVIDGDSKFKTFMRRVLNWLKKGTRRDYED